MNYAVIETGGKQYFVTPDTKIKIEKLSESKGLINFDKVLLAKKGDAFYFGRPNLDNVLVTAERTREGKSKKVIVFKYHSKTRYKKKKGHRQEYTEVEITRV